MVLICTWQVSPFSVRRHSQYSTFPFLVDISLACLHFRGIISWRLAFFPTHKFSFVESCDVRGVAPPIVWFGHQASVVMHKPFRSCYLGMDTQHYIND